MSDQPTFNRRRILELSGVGTALAVAGCTSQLDDDGVEGDRGELEDDERRVTMVIEPDQEALQQRQIELEQEGVDQQEAQAELQELQAELLEQAFENVQAEFAEFDLTIEETLQDQILLVAGRATDLIDAVDVEGIGGLLGSDAFEQAQQQQEQQEEQVPEDGGDEPTEEELEEEIQEELEEAEEEEED